VKTYTSAKKAAEDIRWALRHRKHAHIEIPGGFRYRGSSTGVYQFRKENEFLVMVVKLPVVRLYGIVFQDLDRRLLIRQEHGYLTGYYSTIFPKELAFCIKMQID